MEFFSCYFYLPKQHFPGAKLLEISTDPGKMGSGIYLPHHHW